MKIGIIGAGHVGANAARQFHNAGHEVALSNSRGPASLAALVSQIGPNAHAMTVADAAASGEVVLVAIPFGRYAALPTDALRGKIVVDAMNYYPMRDGKIDLGGMSSSEFLGHRLVGARLVKAFNTMFFQTLAREGRPEAAPEDRLVIFLAGDDVEAKAIVARLIDDIGFAPLDTGSLREGGRRQEPDSPIYNRPMSLSHARRILDRIS